ncbi:glycosyltransferase family 2 protein [Georgenia subflava]|uniref:Glycosyltransferase n=1 Tax=Georgenia subflava TaxID=1622177 RepID=A0A6N7EHI3_9MICO|nr:glycosyltransferase family 2 protein [Georgenia subflava]MPV36593.1 glycosyltransferase [Georgenia subflava]
MASPRVTIGLPVYNGENYLEAAIESVLVQDFEDFELLLADNGSTDRTAEICRSAAARDSRVRIHRSEVNHGAAWNYNRLVDLARGEYFKWAAHDDVIKPAFLRRCVEVLDEDAGVSLAYTRAVDIDEMGAVVYAHRLPGYATQSEPSARASSVLREPSPCMESFGLTRRRQLLRTSLIGPYTGSDRTLFLELSLLGRFYEVPEVLFQHRQHGGRSVRQYADPRARNIWFDPAWEGRRSAPRWRLLREYGRVALTGPASAGERLRTLVPVTRWAVTNRRALVREAGAQLLLRKTADPPRTQTPAPGTRSTS